MPQDFFAQGFGQEQDPVFTKQQNEFLEKKIVFLDPMKTYQISIGKVLALLKYTNLDNETIKKILNNSCANGIGQKVITYEEMKKIFRGVALKQNKIEPSKINIEANIKTKMPIFYDDDESDQEQQQPKPQPVQHKPTEPIKPPSQTHVPPVNQPPQPPKPQQQPPQNNPLKAFDDYWKTLKSKNNLIDGAEVKKMFSNNSANKNNLSKAWKLCNISEKGVLTKGQFFIFMNLIHGGNIPETLTKEMKDLIRQIEESCGYKKAQTQQPTSQRGSSMSNLGPKSKSGGSDAFDKFGDESLFVKNSSKVEELSKSVTIQKSTPNVFATPGPSTLASSSILSPPPTSQNIPQPSSKAALQLLQRVETVSKQQKTHHQELTNLTANNQQLISGLSSIEQYLNMVEENFALTTKKIETIKQTQNTLNERLNNVCVKFKNIITKQSECIAFLMESMKVESEASQQRLEILEGYTEQMLGMVEGNMEVARQQVGNIQKQHSQAYQGVRYQNEQLRENLSGQKSARSHGQAIKPIEHPSIKGSPQISHYTKTDPFDDNEAQQSHQQDHEQQNNQQHNQQQPTSHFSQEPQNNQPAQQTGHIFLENLSPQERKKTKQMLLIQILNSVSSMTQEEYKEVVGKVVAMTEEQMNQSYTKLYALYMQNIAKTGVAPKYPVPSPEEFTASYS